MDKELIVELLNVWGIETFNKQTDKCCMRGINGHVGILYYDRDPLITIRDHLLQMGRDSLKMDLNSLINITSHN